MVERRKGTDRMSDNIFKPAGRKNFYLRIRKGKRDEWISLRTNNRLKAEKKAEEILERDFQRRHGLTIRRKYEEIVEKFYEEYFPTLKPQSARRYMASLRMLNKTFAGMYLDEIEFEHLSDFVSLRRKGGFEITIKKPDEDDKVMLIGPAKSPTIRRDLKCLSSMFTSAIAWGWIKSNPILAFVQSQKRLKGGLKENPPRTRYLRTKNLHDEDEYERLIGAAKSHLKDLIKFAVETGLRKEEQLSLEWHQVDMLRKEITLTKTKTGSPRIIPLNEKAVEVLTNRPRFLHSAFVFTNDKGERYTTNRRSFTTACRDAKVTDLIWHDLRRSYGSWSLQRGVDIHKVSKLLGHASVTITEKVYAFLDLENLRKAVDAADKRSKLE